MLYRPLQLFTLYIIVSVLTSFFGPIVYQQYNKLIVALYMLAFIVMFGIGYLMGAQTRPRPLIERAPGAKLRRVLRVVKTCLWITLIVTSVEFVIEVARGSINLD